MFCKEFNILKLTSDLPLRNYFFNVQQILVLFTINVCLSLWILPDNVIRNSTGLLSKDI